MKLRLVKLAPQYRRHLMEMMEEWYATGEHIVPYAIRRLDYRDFENYLAKLEVKDSSEGLVPDSTFFCLNEERDIFVGAVNIRHYLNEGLLLNGGHIGDGVRPSERRKGIATRMIALALEECRKLGIYRVLMVCDQENIGSAKSIQRNGGVLENEVVVDGVTEQRYWITLERHYDFFQNRACEFFPCHAGADPERFSCLFCYCPLYALGERCGGNYSYTETGVKDCSACLRPHCRENYETITGKMPELAELAANVKKNLHFQEKKENNYGKQSTREQRMLICFILCALRQI